MSCCVFKVLGCEPVNLSLPTEVLFTVKTLLILRLTAFFCLIDYLSQGKQMRPQDAQYFVFLQFRAFNVRQNCVRLLFVRSIPSDNETINSLNL